MPGQKKKVIMILLGLGALTLQGYAQATPTATAPAGTVAAMMKPQGLNLAQKGDRPK